MSCIPCLRIGSAPPRYRRPNETGLFLLECWQKRPETQGFQLEGYMFQARPTALLWLRMAVRTNQPLNPLAPPIHRHPLVRNSKQTWTAQGRASPALAQRPHPVWSALHSGSIHSSSARRLSRSNSTPRPVMARWRRWLAQADGWR